MTDIDRDELRESLSSVTTTEDEFETILAAQKAMRMEHALLCEQMDRGVTSVPATFKALGENAQRHFGLIKEVLGSQRYEMVFQTQETDIMPADRDVFLSEHEKSPT